MQYGGICYHPVIPEEHIESPFTHEKYSPIVSLQQYNGTIHDQLFRFLICKHEFNGMTHHIGDNHDFAMIFLVFLQKKVHA